MRRTVQLVLASLVIALACSSDATNPPKGGEEPPAATSFAFLSGTWSVEGEWRTAAGMESVSGYSVISSSIGGRVFKERWVGRRGGTVVEVLTMFARGAQSGGWFAARADGELGTFEIVQGNFASGVATLATRGDTRVDAGRDRIRYDSIGQDAFRVVAERSTDSGATWSALGTLRYQRAAGTPQIETPPDPAPGCTAPEYREFDFWIGAWAIGGARSDIIRMLGGCVIEENWSSAEIGTSFNMYDPRSGRWTQLWEDTNGNTLLIQGGLEDDGSLMMQDSRTSPRNRITWTPLANDMVRQLGEASSDGVNWTTLYDLTYVPR